MASYQQIYHLWADTATSASGLSAPIVADNRVGAVTSFTFQLTLP